MDASPISSSWGESDLTGTLSMKRVFGSTRLVKGRNQRPSNKKSQGRPVAYGSAHTNCGSRLNMLNKCVVPLRQCPRIKTGDSSSSLIRAPILYRAYSASIAVSGPRSSEEANKQAASGHTVGDNFPFPVKALIKVKKSAPKSGWFHVGEGDLSATNE